MPGRLTIRSGPDAGAETILQDTVTAIGRAEDCALVIPAGTVSGRHVEIRWDGRAYVATDRGSKNGTWVNGQRLEGQHVLREGDVITLPSNPPTELEFDIVSETVTLRLDEELAPHPPAAPAPPPKTATATTFDLRLDRRTAEAIVRGRAVSLTAKEYMALAALDDADGAIVGRNDLARAVWPEYEGAVGDENIEQLVYRLRRKLEASPDRPRHLLTVRGLGYRLVREGAEE